MASAVGVSTKIVFNIRSDYLHLKSYKIRDAKRVEFAEWSLALGPNLKNSLICTDEAYFYLTLPANKQNNRIWAESDPMEGIKK